MDTRSKTNAEHRTAVDEALARHDSNFEELNHNFSRVSDALQGVMAELQAMRISQANRAPDQFQHTPARFHRTPDREVNPFAAADNFHDRPSASTTPLTDVVKGVPSIWNYSAK